jgi:hypothetical protein
LRGSINGFVDTNLIFSDFMGRRQARDVIDTNYHAPQKQNQTTLPAYPFLDGVGNLALYSYHRRQNMGEHRCQIRKRKKARPSNFKRY